MPIRAASRNRGRRHLCGTPRCRHFLRAASFTPSSLAKRAMSASVGIAADDRDHVSPMSRPSWDVKSQAELSSISAMKRSVSLVDRAYIERTKELRKAAGLTQQQMADALQIPLERYKKYENRSRLPGNLLHPFSVIVRRPVEYVLTGQAARHAAR